MNTRPRLGQGVVGTSPSTSVRGQKVEYFEKELNGSQTEAV